MYQEETHGVRVTASPRFMASESSHAQGRYFWAYDIEIVLSRHRIEPFDKITLDEHQRMIWKK